MESTMCHDDGVDYPAASSPSPILHLFTAYYKKNVASLFLFSFFSRSAAHAAAFVWVRVRVPAVALLFARSCFIPGSPLPEYSSSHSGPPQIPISDGSALEFIPHHPAELWPSNSQPLWPRQMNNKTRALRLISGKKREKKKMRQLSARLSSEHLFLSSEVKDLRNIFFYFFCCGNSSRTSG